MQSFFSFHRIFGYAVDFRSCFYSSISFNSARYIAPRKYLCNFPNSNIYFFGFWFWRFFLWFFFDYIFNQKFVNIDPWIFLKISFGEDFIFGFLLHWWGTNWIGFQYLPSRIDYRKYSRVFFQRRTARDKERVRVEGLWPR